MSEQARAIEPTLADPENTLPETKLGGANWFMVVAASFLISALLLAAYHFLIAPKPQSLGMLDMEATLKHQQQLFADMISKGQSGVAYDLASKTGPRLAGAMKLLGQECGCIILVSQAVVDGVPDLTPRMQQLMAIPTTTAGAQK
jgi:hypothetical protein